MAEPIRLTWVFPELVETRWVLPPNRPTALAAVIGVGGASSAAELAYDDALTALGATTVQEAIVALRALIGASPPVVTPVLLSGALMGSSALAGALSVTRALSGQATGSGVLTAALTVEREGLSGTVVAAGLLTGSLEVTRALSGTAYGMGAMTGALTVTSSVPITIDNVVTRSGETYTFTARRTGDVSAARTASYTTSGASDDPASSSDFAGAFPTGSFNFLAGASTATFAVNGTSLVQPE